MAPPPLQALISILHLLLLLLLAASMLLVAHESPAPPPSGGGYIFELKYAGGNETLHHMTLQTGESSVSAIADTGSDLVWLKGNKSICLSKPIKCGAPCRDLSMNNTKCCLDHCMFERKYGDGSFARGFMVNSKVEAKALNVGCAVNFGCPSVNEQDCSLYHTGGIIGLGRGNMSVLSQLVEKKKKFSFCLPGDPKVTSKIKFGDQAAPPRDEQAAPPPAHQAAGQVEFIIKKGDPSKYYVNLKNIQFGNDDLQEKPMDVDDSMLIDSGSSFSKLPKTAFKEIKKRVEESLGQPKFVRKGLPACYEWDGKDIIPEDMPQMVLEFDGDNKMSLPKENYMLRRSSYICLAIKPGGPLTLGNFQMRNISMFFDLTEGPGTLAFRVDNNCAMHQ